MTNPTQPDAVVTYLDAIAGDSRPGTCPDCASVHVVERTDDPEEFILWRLHDESCPVYNGLTRRGDQ